MELIEVIELAPGREDDTVVVAHSATSLTRGLEFGEAVVLRTAEGEHWTAKVRDIGFEVDDTVYTLDLGARLPDDLAADRLEGLDPLRHDLELHEVVDLLGDLRRRGDHEAGPTDLAELPLATV
ncbi:hypothetical protein FB382_003283 [Nocardioides ginsengisegetis]|uniref:Uncharacterized protein n=1 Tax=Nocardioides ginsengisegetis TaxID=661491 RepID=A0A7W3J2B7_9ACTN|nr:hypothetical protein [Nocardioides ginsengisegetis]MBA8804992.1 hypothetical protein [Nocardioides ginsengisegetis]